MLLPKIQHCLSSSANLCCDKTVWYKLGEVESPEVIWQTQLPKVKRSFPFSGSKSAFLMEDKDTVCALLGLAYGRGVFKTPNFDSTQIARFRTVDRRTTG